MGGSEELPVQCTGWRMSYDCTIMSEEHKGGRFDTCTARW
jgi:hypothetical protein